MKEGSFSISALSVTTNLLLLCFRGGFPTMGMVSFGPVLKPFKAVRGGVAAPPTG